jgi:hypothetical protein
MAAYQLGWIDRSYPEEEQSEVHEARKLMKTEELPNLRLHIPLNTSEPEFLDSLRSLVKTVCHEVIESLRCEKKSFDERMLEARAPRSFGAVAAGGNRTQSVRFDSRPERGDGQKQADRGRHACQIHD